MASRSFDIERMQPNGRSAVVGLLARAFYDDPIFSHFVPDPISQSKALLAFMSAGVADAAPFGETWVARTGGKFACAAVWLPPGAYPRSIRRDLLSNLRGSPTFMRSGRRLAGAVRLLTAVDKAHHDITEPHYYLAILGTDPLFQRTGAGSAALQPVLDRCDTEGLSAYLETQKEDNLAYYARHSFELVQKLDVTGVPPIWTLRREPHAS